MADDLYTEWLGVPPGPRPPNLYDLIGVSPFCEDQPRIEDAVRAQMRKLRLFQAHPDRQKAQTCHRMLTAVARARVVLVSPSKKARYDRKLSRELSVELPTAVTAEPAVDDREEIRPAAKSAARRHAEARTALDAVGRGEREEAYADLAYAHLSRWRLNEDELELLVAEARAYDVPDEQARQIIERVAARVEREYRRSLTVMKRTIILGVAAVVLCLLVYGGIQLRDHLRSREADALVLAARESIAKQLFPKARQQVQQASELDSYRTSYFDQVQHEIDVAECEAVLATAHVPSNPLDRDEWAGLHGHLSTAESLIPNHPGIGELRERACTRARQVVHDLVRKAGQLRKQRRWREARESVQWAAELLQDARVPASRRQLNQESLLEEIAAAEQQDWERLATTFQTQLDDWDVESAAELAAEAARVHPQRLTETRAWQQRVSDRTRFLEQLDRDVAGLVNEGNLDRAHQEIDKHDLPEAVAEIRRERVRSAWMQHAGTRTRQALELAGRTERPEVTTGICLVLLENPGVRDLESLLKETLAAALTRADSPASYAAGELPLAELQMRDQQPVVGEIIEQDSLRVRIRPLVQNEPLTLGPDIREIMATEIESQSPWRTLSPEEASEVRKRQLVLELERALRQADHLRALEIVGQLETHGATDLVRSILGQDRKKLENSVWTIAGHCTDCVGCGRITCSNCQGTGRVDGLVDCRKCNGHGWYDCPNCHGKGKANCRRCRGTGRIKDKVGERRLGPSWTQDVYDWVDCPDCRGRKLVTCPACDGSGEISPCPTCKGTGKVPGKPPCPECNGQTTVECRTCGGSGRRGEHSSASPPPRDDSSSPTAEGERTPRRVADDKPTRRATDDGETGTVRVALEDGTPVVYYTPDVPEIPLDRSEYLCLLILFTPRNGVILDETIATSGRGQTFVARRSRSVGWIWQVDDAGNNGGGYLIVVLDRGDTLIRNGEPSIVELSRASRVQIEWDRVAPVANVSVAVGVVNRRDRDQPFARIITRIARTSFTVPPELQDHNRGRRGRAPRPTPRP